MRAHGVPPEPMLSRRRFLQQLEAGAVAATCAGGAARGLLPVLLAACGGARYAASSIDGARLVVERRELGAQGAALGDGPDGELPIYVRLLPDGRFTAVSTRCMHRGCQVEPATDRFVCPCHGSEYTFAGEVLKGPTEHPLVRYRTTADQTRVYVHLDAPMAEERAS
jgi:nitrite reductase/ring-hydroxylating ferredoxin subunit